MNETLQLCEYALRELATDGATYPAGRVFVDFIRPGDEAHFLFGFNEVDDLLRREPAGLRQQTGPMLALLQCMEAATRLCYADIRNVHGLHGEGPIAIFTAMPDLQDQSTPRLLAGYFVDPELAVLARNFDDGWPVGPRLLRTMPIYLGRDFNGWFNRKRWQQINGAGAGQPEQQQPFTAAPQHHPVLQAAGCKVLANDQWAPPDGNATSDICEWLWREHEVSTTIVTP